MHALLEALGRPQAQLRVAHISGTKGKGSTAVMLSAIMKVAGYKVGTYTRRAVPDGPAHHSLSHVKTTFVHYIAINPPTFIE